VLTTTELRRRQLKQRDQILASIGKWLLQNY
jgi:hypothetical protein